MINNKKILSVVTAREGSIGLPGKNFKSLLGRPLVQWSILASLQCPYVDKTVVSSNCEGVKIAYDNLVNELKESDKLNSFLGKDKALGYHTLEWITRPDEFATATSKKEEAMIHAYNYCKDNYGLDFDILENMQPTSPCRNKNLLSKCIEEYEKGGYDSLLTGHKLTPFLWKKQDGKWIYPVDKNHCCDRKMRQQFLESEFVFHDDGNVYLTDTEIMLNTKCRIGENPCFYEIEGINSIQIDTESDFKLIENMAKVYNFKNLI